MGLAAGHSLGWGGEGGGRIVAQGPPEQVARVKKSYTGQVLARTLHLNEKENGSSQGKNGASGKD